MTLPPSEPMLVPIEANYADKPCPSESSDAVCLCIRHDMSTPFKTHSFFPQLLQALTIHHLDFQLTTKQ